MKKKMLLTIIPALMVLSACAGAAPQKEAAPLFQEDTLAHEELFDDAEFVANKLGVKQPLRAASDMVEPQIGVQFKEYTDPSDNTKNYCAIRYVAAIASRHVKAEWVRGVSRQDAYALKAKGIMESHTAYTSLNNNGTIIQSASGSCFVVYTLYDIPLFDNGDNKSCYWSYVAAGLKLTDLDEQEDPVMSKIVAVEIGKHHCFSFYESELNNKEYFLQGKINGSVSEKIEPLDVGTSGNFAQKTLDLKSDDNFGVFKWSTSEFAFYGNHDKTYDKFYITKSETISTNYSKVGVAGEYTFYLNGEGKYGLSASTPVTKIEHIYLDASNWGPSDAKFALWSIVDNNWILPADQNGNVFRFDGENGINLNASGNDFLFARYPNTDSNPVWDPKNIWNQSADINYNSDFVLFNEFALSFDNGNTVYTRSAH